MFNQPFYKEKGLQKLKYLSIEIKGQKMSAQLTKEQMLGTKDKFNLTSIKRKSMDMLKPNSANKQENVQPPATSTKPVSNSLAYYFDPDVKVTNFY